MLLNKNKWIIIMLHLGGWMLFLSYPFLMFPDHHPPPHHPPPPGFPGPGEFFIPWKNIIMNLLMVPVFYLNLHLIYPRLFHRSKAVAFFATQFVILLALIFAYGLLIRLLVPSHGEPLPWIFVIITYLFCGMAAYSYMIVSGRLKSEQSKKDQENVTLKSELQFLRWQISPHFLFNVLNNMAALARTRSEKLEPMILQLATVMRYMLYERDETRITLDKEAEYLQSYIDLQSIRLGKDVKINTDLEVTNGSMYSIEPMLLIPFVENAFKHGTGIIINPVINISMAIRDDHLVFTVENKYMPRYARSDGSPNGIGLINVQRRLNLLYESRHELCVDIKDDWYISSLKIKLR